MAYVLVLEMNLYVFMMKH